MEWTRLSSRRASELAKKKEIDLGCAGCRRRSNQRRARSGCADNKTRPGGGGANTPQDAHRTLRQRAGPREGVGDKERKEGREGGSAALPRELHAKAARTDGGARGEGEHRKGSTHRGNRGRTRPGRVTQAAQRKTPTTGGREWVRERETRRITRRGKGEGEPEGPGLPSGYAQAQRTESVRVARRQVGRGKRLEKKRAREGGGCMWASFVVAPVRTCGLKGQR